MEIRLYNSKEKKEMNEKIVDNHFVRKFVPRNLPWYEREGLLTWYEQTKSNNFYKVLIRILKNCK